MVHISLQLYMIDNMIASEFYVLVGNSSLRGRTDEDAAKVIQWVEFGDNEITPASATWVFPCLGVIQFNKQVGMV